MKNKKIFPVLFLSVIMCGCGLLHSGKPPLRVVTAVDVSCRQENREISRHYESFEKMEAVLLYIRLADKGRPPTENPNTLDADTWQICVNLSDGQQHIYKQKDHRYFYRPGTGWRTLDPAHAAKLYALLRHYKSDSNSLTVFVDFPLSTVLY